MTAQSAPYVRVYYAIVDDPKFKTIYLDDAALATWLRLLMAADAAWPASAVLPRSVKDEPLAILVGVGLVETGDNDTYRIHGLDAERQKQSERGKAGADARWGKKGADAPAMPTHPTPDADALPGIAGGNALRSSPSAPSSPSVAREAPLATVNGGGASPMTPLSDLLPPPPGHRRAKKRPDDEDVAAGYMARHADPATPQSIREACVQQLSLMGYRMSDGAWEQPLHTVDS